jgi:hypothetical protein
LEQEKKNIISTFILIIIIATFTIVVLTVMDNNFIPKKYYKASDFKIKTLYSDSDYDNDNIDDYSEFVVGARKDAQKKPTYISKYYDTSYPPDNEGVCTDVIWRAFKQAGAQTIIMTLWNINDESTAVFMENLYKALLQGKTKREAFNSTMKLQKERYPDPLHWAGFIMLD